MKENQSNEDEDEEIDLHESLKMVQEVCGRVI